MKKNAWLLLLLFIVAFSSCSSPYGERVAIDERLEIYRKGDSVTVEEARNLGNYLADLWKDAPNKKSLQLLKKDGAYVVKMVVDQEKLKADPSLEAAFFAMRILIGQNVFPGQKVIFVITDKQFKTIRVFKEEAGEIIPETPEQ